MKKIKLNESDLLKIINKVLNEQKIRQFDEDEIDILYFIFERELKPPLREGEKDKDGDYPYYNRDGEYIGYLGPTGHFAVINPIWTNIQYKVCQVFQFSYDNWIWWYAIHPYQKSWLENQINVKVKYVGCSH